MASTSRIWFILEILTSVFFVVYGYCPEEGHYDPGTSKCFIFSSYKTDWFTAKEACEKKKAFLAKVESQPEMDFMASVKSKNYYWMGMNDMAVENEFRWLDGSLVAWYKWRSEQPNGGVVQNCTTIDNRWEWQDRECMDEYYFVCNPDSGDALYGSVRQASITDVSLLTQVRSTDREECAARCIDNLQCFYWGYSDSVSSSSKNCNMYKTKSGSSISMSSSWDYYDLEWIKRVNGTT